MSVIFKTHRDKTQFANAILLNCVSKLCFKKRSYRPQQTQLWNSLPNSVKCVKSMVRFKRLTRIICVEVND